MIHSFTMTTAQIDIPAAAVLEILWQLGEHRLRRNTAGILVCHRDFVENGIVAELCACLPFPVVGMTAFSQANGRERGMFSLSVTVLTGDDVGFHAVCSAPCAGGGDAPGILRRTYAEGCRPFDEPPALILSFVPEAMPLRGDAFLCALDGATGGVPCFGAYAYDGGAGQAAVLCGGGAYTDRCALLLLFGEVRADFHVAGLPREQALSPGARVTKARTDAVETLDGVPLADYLTGLGLTDTDTDGMRTLALLVRRPGERRCLSGTLLALDARGAGILSREVSLHATLYLGCWTGEEVLNTAHDALRQALKASGSAPTVLMFSGIGRHISLGPEAGAEADIAASLLGGAQAYLLSTSGGEICPLASATGTTNQIHHGAMAICVLQ